MQRVYAFEDVCLVEFVKHCEKPGNRSVYSQQHQLFSVPMHPFGSKAAYQPILFPFLIELQIMLTKITLLLVLVNSIPTILSC